MTRQASGGGARRGADGWQALAGAYTAAGGCEYQAMAFGILAQCGEPRQPAERAIAPARIAERDPR